MSNGSQQSRTAILHMHMSEFWSGDLGLTLVSISLMVLIFVIFPLRQTGLSGRFFFDLVMVTLMISGALVVSQSRIVTIITVAMVVIGAVVLWASRFYPSPFLRHAGSVFSIIILLLYVRIVLLVMFRQGPVSWSRIQGGVCAYLLIGMAWASAFDLVEQIHPGSFHFVSEPTNMDQLTSKLIYFSFATLTTVGFGDVLPVYPFARSLAIAEAIVGQLFPAILIGALVAMAMQARAKS
ncbi:MAG TPA: potassium channel family protein [Candidatus Acidoferrum sp.]|nr:potassium channel family protein [Candidatus Acidoferrum sp.]